MWASTKKYFSPAIWAIATITLLSACKKEYDYVYDVNPVTVNQGTGTKANVKTTTEFVSIAYKDIFGSTISANYMNQLSLAYLSFGDKKLIEDIIIKNMLNLPGAQIPTPQQMAADIDGFTTASYKKFYNREPSEFELWKMKELITSDNTVTPELIYYAFLTSNEYRYY